MTKSKGIGRGGARPGSGRKKKPVAPISQFVAPVGASEAEIRKARIEWSTRNLEILAGSDPSGSVRLKATQQLLDRDVGKPRAAPAPKSDDGQRELADDWGDLLDTRPPTTAGRSN